MRPIHEGRGNTDELPGPGPVDGRPDSRVGFESRHLRAEQSGPARIGATRAGVRGGSPRGGRRERDPDAAGGGGECPRRPPPAERKTARTEAPSPSRARWPGTASRAPSSSPRSEGAPFLFLFLLLFPRRRRRATRTRTRPPPRTRLPRSRHDTRLSPFYPRTARLRYGARRARRRRGRTRTRPGARRPARSRRRTRTRDTRTTSRFFLRSEAPIGSSSGRHRRTIRALRTKTRGTRIPTIPSRSRRRRTCPATFPTGWSSLNRRPARTAEGAARDEAAAVSKTPPPFRRPRGSPADREGDAHSLGAVLRETLRRAARVPVRGKRAELGVQRAEKHNQLLVRRRDGWATGSRLGVGTHRTGSRGNLRVVAEHPPLD